MNNYKITGMTCSSCEIKVKTLLSAVPGVVGVKVSKENNAAEIDSTKEIALSDLQEALGGREAKYQIASVAIMEKEDERTWLATYKPILLIFGYLLLISGLAGITYQRFDMQQFMRVFMAGFFLTFSFFKFLNLKAFAESYAMYDIVAKRFKLWGYIYAFLELFLGVAYAINVEPVFINWFTLILMGISIVGVVESVLNQKRIKCACLGAVFNLPMSTVTIVEDALMIAMSGAMLFYL